jgi:hypothetical protein
MVDFAKFNWTSIFNVIKSVESMNRNQLRSLKAEILEKSIAKHSDGQLSYVGDTNNGVDFVDADGVRFECKSRINMFSVSKNNCTKEIILKNFYRKSTPVITQTFDHLIMVDTNNNTVGVVDYDTAIEYSIVKDSIVTTKVALSKIKYVAENIITTNVINFEQLLNAMIIQHI